MNERITAIEWCVRAQNKERITAIEWCVRAQNVVAYPEDFGMNRQQVRGLERVLAERRQQLEFSREWRAQPAGGDQ